MAADPLRPWKRAAFVASLIIVLTIPVYLVKERVVRSRSGDTGPATATFVGREKCVSCHREAYEKWLGSHHDRAMAVAADSTVLGDFDDTAFEHGGISSRFYRKHGKYFVHTEGADGEMDDFEIAYTFGVEPLQQYLIPFPGGRYQALSIAWDSERGRWFHLYPDEDIPPGDWLHWTRNGQNWNGMCAECHSTNLQKGYDPASETFTTTWSEIDVSCEACHGPGSRHVEWAEIEPMGRPAVENLGLLIKTSGISSQRQVELCASCHSRRTEFGDYDHTKIDLMENLVPAVLREGLYFADGQVLDEVYVYGSFVQSKMYRNKVRCGDCHDVHSLRLVKEGNDLCLQCHRADAYDTYDHHFHKKIYEGKPSDGALCIKCHMPERPYMVIDWRADHSMRAPRPDLTQEIGTPNSCGQGGCHDDKSVEWSVTHFTEWYGRARKPHYGRILHAGREGDPEAYLPLVRLAGDTLYPAIVRATALSLLGSYPGEESTRAFNTALQDEDGLVRYTAVQSVNTSDPRVLVDLVAPLLFDPLKVIRGQSATRLAALPPDLLKPYQSEALQTALSEYEQAMERSLDFAFAGHNLGNLYANLGQHDKAEAYFKTAIEIDGLFYPPKMNLAVLYSQMGRNKEAEALLREVLEAYPEMHDAAYSLALLLAEMNRHAEAVEFLQKALEGMPEVARVQYNLGLILQYLQRDAEAEAALAKALAIEPENVDYLYALADHYVKRGRFQEALPLAEKMVAVRPDVPAGHSLKAFIERALQAPVEGSR
ncbi:MAG: tetratricopeptide repeat protein [Candidatus Krumholzibacteria bacterium]